MVRKALLHMEQLSIPIEFEDHALVDSIYREMPFESRVSTWGEEIYFPIPLEPGPVDPTRDVEAGDVAYWAQGHSLAIFFGPTPMSEGNKPVPADAVDVIGRVRPPYDKLRSIQAGETLTLKPAPDSK